MTSGEVLRTPLRRPITIGGRQQSRRSCLLAQQLQKLLRRCYTEHPRMEKVALVILIVAIAWFAFKIARFAMRLMLLVVLMVLLLIAYYVFKKR